MKKKYSIMWFRQDLRLHDNTALKAALNNDQVIPLFIYDDSSSGQRQWGGASQLWLHHSLRRLDESLHGRLLILCGNPLEILKEITQKHSVQAIHWNRLYDSESIQRDREIKEYFREKGIDVQSHQDAVLWEPWTVLNQSKKPYRVFTPFYRKGCLSMPEPIQPDNKDIRDGAFSHLDYHEKSSINDLQLLDGRSWGPEIMKHWNPGEEGAQLRLAEFIDQGLLGYREKRNVPNLPNVSRLSPHIHWGEISIRTVWHTIKQYAYESGYERDVDHFLSELGWREFSHSLLYFNPRMVAENLQKKFDFFPWQNNPEALKAWKMGQTGIPIVDAGMRELRQTGYMHSRLRMIVGSFLVKNLLIDWREGEQWFWNSLVDADVANNAAGWQWIAGSGADAAPYYRIFNPILQGEKFDADGGYTRRFVPELKNIPNRFLFCPWEAPIAVLQKAGIELGVHYPKPIVNLKMSREQALAAYQEIKKEGKGED